jgi:hypothetical protein
MGYGDPASELEQNMKASIEEAAQVRLGCRLSRA